MTSKIVLVLVAIAVFYTEACLDSSTSCATWAANGFCTSTFYTTAQKTQYCAATCNLCSSSATSTSSSVSSSSTSISSSSSTATSSAAASTTSGAASTAATSSTCQDGSSNCANWVANGFCTSTFYTTAQKTAYCGKSCNLC